jgi:hypothetical protein
MWLPCLEIEDIHTHWSQFPQQSRQMPLPGGWFSMVLMGISRELRRGWPQEKPREAGTSGCIRHPVAWLYSHERAQDWSERAGLKSALTIKLWMGPICHSFWPQFTYLWNGNINYFGICCRDQWNHLYKILSRGRSTYRGLLHDHCYCIHMWWCVRVAYFPFLFFIFLTILGFELRTLL